MIMNEIADKPEKPPLHLAGLGVPLIDFITPSEQELIDAEALITRFQSARANGKLSFQDDNERLMSDEVVVNGIRRITAAKEALQAFNHYWKEERQFQNEKDNKITLTDEETAKISGWFSTMVDAVRYTKIAAGIMKEPEQLLVRHMGGTLSNKFHAIKSAMGTRVAPHMLGALGEEDGARNRQRVLESLQDSNVDFQLIPDVSLGNMAVSYIIPFNGDRIVLKAPFDHLAEKLHAHQDSIDAFATDISTPANGLSAGTAPDMYFIEGTDYGPKKLGAETFDRFAQAALASGKPIIFSPPTDTKMLVDEDPKTMAATLPYREKARAAMDQLIDSPNTALITMNESEVVAMFTERSYSKIKGVEPENHPQVLEALDALSARLKAKAALQPEGAVEPLAFVSAGKGGSFYVTPHGYDFVEQRTAENNISTIGAGDAFSSGVFVQYMNMCEVLKEQGRSHFTPDELASITNRGQELGREVVSYKGAQLPTPKIAATAYGPSPVSWVKRTEGSNDQAIQL